MRASTAGRFAWGMLLVFTLVFLGCEGFDSTSPTGIEPGGIVRLSSAAYLEDLEGGGLFVTGHDPDYHAVRGFNAEGAEHILQRAVEYVTFGVTDPSMLLVTDLRNPGGDESDPRLGLAEAGFTFDVADSGSGEEGAVDLDSLAFTDYDVVVVASDYGGWLRQVELDILNDRSADLIDYVNGGGGLVVLSESGARPEDADTIYTGTTQDRYGFLPFLVTEVPLTQNEVGYTLTPLGISMGLAEEDVNNNVSHVIFTETGGMGVVDLDPDEQPVSLATRSPITPGGVVIQVALDIKPTSCPNPFNVKSRGVLPAAILGSENLDVEDVDPDSLRLLEVPPLRWGLEDVATPPDTLRRIEDRLDCSSDGPDGNLDLTLKFDRQEVLAAIEEHLGRPVEDREVIILTLTGKLRDEAGGNTIQGEDVIWILKKGKLGDASD
jgi:hypothetical protein